MWELFHPAHGSDQKTAVCIGPYAQCHRVRDKRCTRVYPNTKRLWIGK